jgi:hypothetical protein
MAKLLCTEPVCRHEWAEARDPEVPRCPRCGGFWVRVVDAHVASAAGAGRRPAGGRPLARRISTALR